jgi:membrane fusion protein (multidrug efflux system)
MTMNQVIRATPRRAFLLALLLPALAACGSDAPETEAAEAPPLVLAATDVAVVERGAIESGVSLTGTLEPYRVVEVRAQVSGTVGAVRVEEGDAVGQGAVLAVIQAEGIRSQAASTRAGVGSARAGVTSAQAGVSGARAGVAAAEAQLAVVREQAASAQLLYSQGAMSRLDHQAAQAQVQAAEAALASARGQVEAAQGQVAAAGAAAAGAGEQAARTVVRAPFAGAVSARTVEPGEAVSPGNTLFTVVNTSAFEMAAQVGVDEVSRIRVGAPVEFHLDAYPGRTFTGTVARIEPTADPDSRQVGVYLRLPNPGDLVGGLFATGTILTETLANELLVPAGAVHEDPGTEGTYVLVVDDGVIRRRAVSVVARDATRGVTAVSGEVEAGDHVVVAPTTDTAEGARVRIAAPGGRAPATPVENPDSAATRAD